MTRGNGAGDAANGHAGAAAQSRNGPYFGMIPRRTASLRLPRRVHAVLDIIACHARGGWARLSLDTIANEVGIDRSKVCLCIRSLEKKGVVEVVRRGGRGLANAYRVIPDAEAVPPAAQATAAENSAVFGTETTARNSADCGNVSDENSAALGTVSNAKQCRFRHPNRDSTEEEKTPPSGESRAREEDFSNDWVNEKQGVLLPPINGGGDRMAPLRRYNPSAELLDWAREFYGVNALDERVLGEFIDWHIEHNNLPGNIGAIEAAYRRWIRREARFAGQSRHRRQQHSNAAEAEVEGVVEAVRRMRAMRANGAGND
jgi:hypothetical protein